MPLGVSKTMMGYLSVTLQPLICSDVLNLPRDTATVSPMEAVRRHGEIFGEHGPEHVDLVSVSTCTPQVASQSPKGIPYRTWHVDFLNAFVRAASEDKPSSIKARTGALNRDRPGGIPGWRGMRSKASRGSFASQR